MTTDITREQLLARQPQDYLRDGLSTAAGTLRPELAGIPAFAVATQLDEAMASPQEVALTFEMLKQVLGVSQGDGRPAGDRFLAASRDALDHVARLLSKVNNIVLDGWLEDCAPFIKTEADIQAFIALFQTVLQQYTALQAVKPPTDGA